MIIVNDEEYAVIRIRGSIRFTIRNRRAFGAEPLPDAKSVHPLQLLINNLERNNF
jgi:hypothetical protein